MQARAAMKAAGVMPQAGHKAQELQEEADWLRADAEALKDWGPAAGSLHLDHGEGQE